MSMMMTGVTDINGQTEVNLVADRESYHVIVRRKGLAKFFSCSISSQSDLTRINGNTFYWDDGLIVNGQRVDFDCDVASIKGKRGCRIDIGREILEKNRQEKVHGIIDNAIREIPEKNKQERIQGLRIDNTKIRNVSNSFNSFQSTRKSYDDSESMKKDDNGRNK